VQPQPFNDRQIDRFHQRNAPGGVHPDRHRARVRTFLSKENIVAEAAREPLILRMLSEVVGEAEFHLPENPAQVFEELAVRACVREIDRHDLPPDLPQMDFLGAVAELLVDSGENSVDKEFLQLVIEEELGEYFAITGMDDEARVIVSDKLADHYMLTPEEFEIGAQIQFRHPSLRDFFMALRVRKALAGVGAARFEAPRSMPSLEKLLGRRDLPNDTLRFLADLVATSELGSLKILLGPGNAQLTRNGLLLTLMLGEGALKDCFPPPSSLSRLSLDGIVFEEVDLSGYAWDGASLDGATFRSCNLAGCLLGKAAWREIHLDGCTLDGTDLGDPAVAPRVFLDGKELSGPELADELRRRGALGPGARDRRPPELPEDSVANIVREVFAKVVEGDRRDNTRVTKKKRSSFERGRFCAENAIFVREIVLPTLVANRYLRESGDRHGTLTAGAELGDIIDFLFEGTSSRNLVRVIDELSRERQ
jgi:hypothetical protein